MTDGYQLSLNSIKAINNTIKKVNTLYNNGINSNTADNKQGRPSEWFFAILTEESTVNPGVYSWRRVENNPNSLNHYKQTPIEGKFNAFSLNGESRLPTHNLPPIDSDGHIDTTSSDNTSYEVVLMKLYGINMIEGGENTSGAWFVFMKTNDIYQVFVDSDVLGENYILGRIYNNMTKTMDVEVKVAKPWDIRTHPDNSYIVGTGSDGSTMIRYDYFEHEGEIIRQRLFSNLAEDVSYATHQELVEPYMYNQRLTVAVVKHGTGVREDMSDEESPMIYLQDLNDCGRRWQDIQFLLQDGINMITLPGNFIDLEYVKIPQRWPDICWKVERYRKYSGQVCHETEPETITIITDITCNEDNTTTITTSKILKQCIVEESE